MNDLQQARQIVSRESDFGFEKRFAQEADAQQQLYRYYDSVGQAESAMNNLLHARGVSVESGQASSSSDRHDVPVQVVWTRMESTERHRCEPNRLQAYAGCLAMEQQGYGSMSTLMDSETSRLLGTESRTEHPVQNQPGGSQRDYPDKLGTAKVKKGLKLTKPWFFSFFTPKSNQSEPLLTNFKKVENCYNFPQKKINGTSAISDNKIYTPAPITETAKKLRTNGKPVLSAIFDIISKNFTFYSEKYLTRNLLSAGGGTEIIQVYNGGLSSYLTEMSRLIMKARKTIEISLLTPPARGTKTYDTLVQSFAELAKSTLTPIDIRIVYGRMPPLLDHKLGQPHIRERDYLENFINDIKKTANIGRIPFNIQLTGFTNSGVSINNPFSWNHSKLIVIDRKICNTGGTNLYEGYNHQDNPIRDVSTTYESHRLASQAANFIYGLATTEDQRTVKILQRIKQTSTAVYTQSTNTTILVPPSKTISGLVADFLPGEQLDDFTREEFDKIDTMVVSRYGVSPDGIVGIEKENLSDTILPTFIRQAQHSLIISQQALSPIYKISGITVGHNAFNNAIISSIKYALKKGVQVTIIKSPSKYIASDGGVYDGLSGDGIRKLLNAADNKNLVILIPGKEINGNTITSANHAKVIIVDEEAAYVGSHNAYDSSLAEYGIIREGKEFVQKVISEYIVKGFYGGNRKLFND